MHRLYACIYFLIRVFVEIPWCYIQGFFFLVTHPIMFIDFVETFKDYYTKLKVADEVAASGFHDLPRSQRRKLQLAGRRMQKKGAF